MPIVADVSKTEELFVLFSSNNKEELELAVEYLTKEMNLCRDYPPQIIENFEEEMRYYHRDWVAVVPKEVSRYSTTIEKVQCAKDDFLAGLRKGMELGKQKHIEYIEKLKVWGKGKTQLTPREKNCLNDAINALNKDRTVDWGALDKELLRLALPRVPHYLKGVDIRRSEEEIDFYHPKTQFRIWKAIKKYKKILGLPTVEAAKLLVECLPEHCEKCRKRLECITIPK